MLNLIMYKRNIYLYRLTFHRFTSQEINILVGKMYILNVNKYEGKYYTVAPPPKSV